MNGRQDERHIEVICNRLAQALVRNSAEDPENSPQRYIGTRESDTTVHWQQENQDNIKADIRCNMHVMDFF